MNNIIITYVHYVKLLSQSSYYSLINVFTYFLINNVKCAMKTINQFFVISRYSKKKKSQPQLLSQRNKLLLISNNYK